ncbi:hypothetical protein CcI156_22790 [Frankia sp. CcI156]|uniref:Uncharacterized protein n=1 Tax=Frankia casuarinae (strain DSM 45818 / CECT 9043 / HFP020203 / CcI3) TaxID=106370 RepID=Q2J9Z5_FRACC|nr:MULTISPECIES: hypothetical protein [Frankia]ONH21794.1 hypothetical protein CcI156_22790 [Frankia sp. CcI156]ABD11897.1 hypothetical protein Francci3_2532 [Frankia casuarinae]ESZ99646.1 hypothetical protein CcI6DRAFT_04946 [Frankia sp. CcI6]EYT89528.1 hypothetical protein ThrDRAFT_04858 [Frankia casuarinae]KDA40399.1 hypothetical protein BMG523Draft_04800 [Frankia sp. BMG5.23]
MADASRVGAVPDPLDQLTKELAPVRSAASPLDLEPLLRDLPALTGLGIVRGRVHAATSLGLATAVLAVVREAAASLDEAVPEHNQVHLLFRVHPKTARLTPAGARQAAQEVSGVEMRQFRFRQEGRLRRLVAQQLLEMQYGADHRPYE